MKPPSDLEYFGQDLLLFPKSNITARGKDPERESDLGISSQG